ncbi:hypothetical protein O181_061603 [Austropuccinia psidii MF-1]|uniref:DUF4939 domain-containing protein n=1 Tax=Austropuccinia psidii MF-1 TaxID=1389203 RepID=A0A9Q3HYQ2_9BASI|nr:hypothetical protein [Austropuccinia psidii MF-1]
MQQMTQIRANIQEASGTTALKTPSMKAPDFFDGTQPFKVRSPIQSFQLIFHNEKGTFSEEKKGFLYVTSFHTGRVTKWIEPFVSNPINQDPN